MQSISTINRCFDILQKHYEELSHEEKLTRIRKDAKKFSCHNTLRVLIANIREEERERFGISYLLDLAYYMFNKKQDINSIYSASQNYLLNLATIYKNLDIQKKTRMIHRIAREIRKHPLFDKEIENILIKERRKEKLKFGTSFISNLVYYMYN